MRCDGRGGVPRPGGGDQHPTERGLLAAFADTLHISLSTVKTHLTSVMAKLGARNRVEIALWAYQTRRITAGPGSTG